MNTKKISDVEAFKRESDKARNIPLSQEDIKRINDLAREVEKEESENNEDDFSIVAKNKIDTESSHIQG